MKILLHFKELGNQGKKRKLEGVRVIWSNEVILLLAKLLLFTDVKMVFVTNILLEGEIIRIFRLVVSNW